MARINLSGVVAESARTPLNQVRADGFALAAPGRAVADVGKALQSIGDTLGAIKARQDDTDIQRSLSQFDFESEYIKRREAALRDGTIDGFHARTSADYDAAVTKHLDGIENGRVRREVERRLLSMRPGFLSNAAKAEEGVLTRDAEIARGTKISEAVASFDYSARFLELATGEAVNDPNFSATISEDYRTRVDDYVSNIPDMQTREAVRQQLLGRAGTYTAQAANAAKKNALEAADTKTNAALDNTLNVIRSDPNAYGTGLEDGFRIIDDLDRPEAVKLAMKEAFRHDAARARFDAGIAAAETADELDVIEAEITSETWQKQLDPKDTDSLLDQIRVARAGGRQALAAQVRTDMETARERLDVGIPVGDDEIRRMELGARAAANSGLQMDVAKLAARNRILKTYGDKPLPVIREEIRRRKEAEIAGTRGGGKSLPPELRESIYGAGAETYGVSKEFLSGLAHFEYEMHFRPGVGETDYTHGTAGGSTSAVGPFQFTEDTWRAVVIGNMTLFPEAVGKTDDEILALRGDVDVATRAAALYAKQNGATLTRMLGRAPTDAELVTAHFLGAGGAFTLIGQMARDPNQDASAVLPKAAENNPGIFKFRDGRNRSLAQVMDRIVERSLGNAGSDPLAGVELQAFEAIEKRQAQLAKTNMMGLVAATPAADESMAAKEGGFSAENMRIRGNKARYAAEANAIPQSEWTPLMPDEVQFIQSYLEKPESTVDDQLAMASVLGELGPRMSLAAYRQVGLGDPVFAHAAALMHETDDPRVARQILMGRKLMAERPDALGGASKTDTENQFRVHAGEALAGIANTDGIYKSALAHYAATRDPTDVFSPRDFRGSIEAVLGSPIARINGADTILPSGLDENVVETFLEKATPADLVGMSMTGEPPVGEDMADALEDAQLQAVGGGFYRVILDGKVMVTSQSRGIPFILRLDPEQVRAIAARED